MKNSLFFLFLCALPLTLFSQQEAAIWYFGRNAGLDFRSGSPVVLHDGQTDTFEGCSSIADYNGNLLFYTDGITVWNRNHQQMPNGFDLLGAPSSAQSGIIVPKPNDPDTFYIFTALSQARGSIHYSEVDMTLNGGLGDISIKNVPLGITATEKLTAVVHTNRTDIWVVSHEWGNNTFAAYLVTPGGVNPVPVRSNVGIELQFGDDRAQWEAIGYMKVSPDGSKLALCHRLVGAELLDFNSTTGQVSNAVQMLMDQDVYGVEFSPSSEVLYLSTLEPGEVFQYDLNAPDIPASETLITAPEENGSGMQLALDGKIYVVYSRTLSVINDPDVVGPGCNFTHDAIDMSPGRPYLGLPPFIQSFFLVTFKAENFCLGDATEFAFNSNEPITTINWDFGDGNTSTLEDPTHTYAAPGNYIVSVTATTASDTKTETKEITIYEPPVANPVTDFEVCSVEPDHEFDLTLKNVEISGTQSTTDFGVDYYASLADAQNGTNALPILYTNTNALETVYARIYNMNNPACFDIADFELIVKEAPVLNAVTDWTVCDTDTDGFFDFDLSQKTDEVLNGQSDTTFTVNYFASQADADSNTNSIGENFTNASSLQPIFFRVSNTGYPECFETGSFDLEVITAVLAHAPAPLEVCDTYNDGVGVFDLTIQSNVILGGQSPTSFTVSYHATQAEAETGVNPLNATSYTNTVPNSETVYARVQNNGNANCYNTISFELIVYDSPVRHPVTDWFVCDDNNDGSYAFDLTEKNNEVLGGQSGLDFTISYHESEADAMADQNEIMGAFQNSVNPQTIYYRLEAAANATCFLIDSFSLQVFDMPTGHAPTPMVVCDLDETGIHSFDLSTKDAEILAGQNPNDYSISYFSNQVDAQNNQNVLSRTAYANSAMQKTVYARIENNGLGDCYALTNFEIIVNPLPRPALEDFFVICPDNPELTLDGGDFETWSWRNGNDELIGSDRYLTISQLGGYSLTVSQNNNNLDCETVTFFEVDSSGAPEAFTTHVEGFSDRVTITIDATGIGDFEYSVDGENYQDSNRLEVFPGTYTVYVRDKLLCRTISREVVALGYQKFFTPNGDGTNEYWNIIGTENYPDSELYIHDRYGKLVMKLNPISIGWDGTFNGSPMPSSDYWFRYVYDNGKVFKGHFSLKR